MCNGTVQYPEAAQVADAAARVRRPGPKCASPTCVQKGSILGTSRRHYKEVLVQKVILDKCQHSLFSLTNGYVVRDGRFIFEGWEGCPGCHVIIRIRVYALQCS